VHSMRARPKPTDQIRSLLLSVWLQRNKRLLGSRLARAAKAIVYGDKATAYTGPVLAGCSLAAGTLTLQFDKTLFPPGESLHFKGLCA
jgi:hypothetical protein